MSDQPCKPGWQQKSLIQLAEYHNGAAFNQTQWSEEGLPIIRIEQMTNPQAKCDFFAGTLLPNNRIDDGDLIFSWSATLKVLLWDRGPGALNQHLFKVVPRTDTDLDFIKHLIDFNLEKLGGSSQGSTMKHVTRKELARHHVCVPSSLEEQRWLALILDTIEGQIGKTEALIAKYQQIKAGLMHDLFTRGITANGDLRPIPETAPDLYKNSPIGLIPMEWDFDVLGRLTTKIVDGVHNTPQYVTSGVPFVTVKNLTKLDDDIDFTDLNYITTADHTFFTVRADPTAGDVLVTKDGTLGVARIVRKDHPDFSIFVSVAQLRPIKERLRPGTLHSFFDSAMYERQLGGLSAGSGLKHIHLEHFRRFVLPLPSPAEQDEISLRTDSVRSMIRALNHDMTNLIKIKSGLARDLLRGDFARGISHA